MTSMVGYGTGKEGVIVYIQKLQGDISWFLLGLVGIFSVVQIIIEYETQQKTEITKNSILNHVSSIDRQSNNRDRRE